MSGHVWCLIASIFLYSIKAEPQSYYEFPVVSSTPSPVLTQTSPQPELTGTNEVVLLLTPNQVETLQAAGAVVRPFSQYGSEPDQPQEQLQQNVEQNGQQYQIVSASEGLNQDSDLENYYKLLNIQEINDDLAQQAEAAEGTTEKPKEIPRYKYTKSRPQYKDKEYFSTYVPKKASRPNSNENTNTEYVRFLPNYENENLKIAPYEPLPLSAYQFAELQANAYIQANAEAQRNSYAQINQKDENNNEDGESNEASEESEESMNEESEENANEESEENSNEESEENTNEEPQRGAYNQVNKGTQRYVYNQANKEVQRNVYKKTNKEAQQSRYTQTKGAQRNTYNQANKEAKRNGSSRSNEEAQRNSSKGAQQNAYNKANQETQRTTPQANKGAQRYGYNRANNEGKQKSYNQGSKGRNAYNQAKKESGQNSAPMRDYIPIKEEPENPQALEEILPVIAQTPDIVNSHLRALDTAKLKKTITSIEGLSILKKQQKAEAPALRPPTVQTPTDKLSLLLAPLYQHKVITDTIARKKEELLTGEQKIHSKLQQLKNSPLNSKEYATEIEKLTSNLGKQNVLAEIEAEGRAAISKTPAVLLNPESVNNGDSPVLVRVPKPLDVKIPAPYPVPLQIIRPLPTREQKPEKVEEEKPLSIEVQRQIHVPGTTNVYVNVNNQLGQKEVPGSAQRQVTGKFPALKPEQITILRHIWEHK